MDDPRFDGARLPELLRKKRRRLVAIIVSVGTAGLLLLIPPTMIELDESAIPKVEHLHTDVDAEAYQSSTDCGSGGCSLRIRVLGGDGAQPLLERLQRLEGDCEVIGGLDLRQVCVAVAPGTTNLFYISFKRHLAL